VGANHCHYITDTRMNYNSPTGKGAGLKKLIDWTAPFPNVGFRNKAANLHLH